MADPVGDDPADGPGPGSPWFGVGLVAGVTFRDLLRRPGGWIATLLTAALFALLVGSLGLTNARVEDRAESRSFKVAFGGDTAGAARTLEALASPRLVLLASDDVATDVTESRASAGIEFPEGTDRRLDAGETVEVKMYQRVSSATSTEAFNTVGVRLQEIELARTAGGRGESLAISAPDVVVVDLPRDARLNRIQLARQLAPIGALLCIGVVTSIAAILGAARERRSIEPLLLLPLARRAIAFGIAFGAFPLACVQLLAAVLLLVLTAAIPSSSSHQDAATIAVMLLGGTVTALLLALVATGFGCLAGALGTGTDDAVSLGDLVSVLFVVVGVVAFSSPAISGAWLYAIPILGQVLIMRDAVGGTAAAPEAVIATISAVVTFVVLVRWTGDRLGDDRRLARAIR